MAFLVKFWFILFYFLIGVFLNFKKYVNGCILWLPLCENGLIVDELKDTSFGFWVYFGICYIGSCLFYLFIYFLDEILYFQQKTNIIFYNEIQTRMPSLRKKAHATSKTQV